MHLSSRDIRRQVGQLAIVGFAGVDPPAELRALIKEFGLAGAILFGRNVESPEQVAGLAGELRELGDDQPLWVGVDQEGGRVARLKAPFTEWPPMAALGRAGDAGLAERFACALATELAAVGITLDFAPVLDIHSNPENPVIGDRALSDQAEVVARLGAVIVRTLQAHGVAACGKHFPGHGDTSVDSHVDLPIVEHARERLDAVELLPFRVAIAAGVASVMTAHVLVPALDEQYPATLSRPVVDELLRRGMNFDGLVISDDLCMGAITTRYKLVDAAPLAIAAGCDLVLLCSPQPDEHASVLEALVHAVEDGRLPITRVEDALARQSLARERYLAVSRPRLGTKELRATLGSAEHRALAQQLARYA